jgi:hypothetical protein
LARNGRADWSRSRPLSGVFLPRQFGAVEAEDDPKQTSMKTVDR